MCISGKCVEFNMQEFQVFPPQLCCYYLAKGTDTTLNLGIILSELWVNSGLSEVLC